MEVTLSQGDGVRRTTHHRTPSLSGFHLRRLACTQAILLAAIVLVSGCSGSPTPAALEPNSAVFAGLPSEVVAERLGDPELQEILRNPAPWTREEIAQNNISFTILCRDILEAEQRWRATGDRPGVPELVSPDNPVEGFASAMENWLAQVGDAIDAGDPAVLREWLTAEGGCRLVIADPKTSDTQTVADVLAQ